MKTAIIILSDRGEEIARKIGSEMEVEVFSVQERKGVVRVEVLGKLQSVFCLDFYRSIGNCR